MFLTLFKLTRITARPSVGGLDEVRRFLRNTIQRGGQVRANLHRHDRRVYDANVCGVIDLQLRVNNT